MRLKVRRLQRLKSGGTSASDHLVEVPGRRIGIGRGTDNEVFLKDLRVNFKHARILIRDADTIIEAEDDSLIEVDEVPVDRAVIDTGSEIKVGPYRLALLKREPDADLVITVELVSPVQADSVQRLVPPDQTRLEGGIIGRRSMSWTLFVLVLALTLALPILAHMTSDPERAERTVTAEKADEEGGALLAGFDQFWISGELSGSHKMLNDDCGACHESAFIPVRDSACADCHASIQHHFETERFTFESFEVTGCTGCHTEHVGPDGVTPAAQSLCADCHAELEQTHPETTLVNATDFGADHPEFRVSVIVDPASGQVERAELGAQTFPKEVSNLRFPHDIHTAEVCRLKGPDAIPADQASDQDKDACTVLQMAAQRMDRPEGLDCADCHRPEPGGVSLLPVTMAEHCADCHRLEFDADVPDRQLPHGQPDEVIAVINDFYAAKALREGSPQAVQVIEQATLRRRPGGESAGQAPSPAPAPPPDQVAEARFVSDQKLASVFGDQLCGVCHETVAPDASTTGTWQVKPVRVADVWMPKAIFDHAAHTTSACTDCHEAETSATSADVLMPQVDGCRDCHLGQHADQGLPSTCIMCHVYHQDLLPPMLPDEVRSAQADR